MSDVDKLWELQSVMTQLGDREKRMAVPPEEYDAIDRQYQLVHAEIAKVDEQLEVLAKERRRVEGELSDQQELLKKYQGQLMQVKNQQQYAAAWKEIDSTRKGVKDLEESLLKSMGEVETLEKQRDERRPEYDDLKSRREAAYSAWQGSLGDLRKEADELRARAAAIESQIPPALRREFQRIFKQRQGVAMVRVAGDSCSACRSRVRPALQQQLKRGELVNCEGCHRILYLEKPS